MLVLEFEDGHWLCRPHEWQEFLQLARVGGFDGYGMTEDPADRIYSRDESTQLRQALESVLDDIPNEAAYASKAYCARSPTGRIERLYPYPGEKLTPFERHSGPRKARLLQLIRQLHGGAFNLRPLGPPSS